MAVPTKPLRDRLLETADLLGDCEAAALLREAADTMGEMQVALNCACDRADYEARILAALEPAAPTWHRMDDAEVMTHPKVVEFVKAISGYVSAIAAFDGSGNMTDKIARLEGCASSLAAAVSGVTPAPAEGGEG